jgi:Zn-dependent alcohol dehydrogenase
VLASDKTSVIGGGYFGQSSFASPVPVKLLCASNATEKILDVEELQSYAPLGCGTLTGADAITHGGKCEPDDVVRVIGVGGVGLAGSCSAKARDVEDIVAINVLEPRLELAKTMGATAGLVSEPELLKDKNIALYHAINEITPRKVGCSYRPRCHHDVRTCNALNQKVTTEYLALLDIWFAGTWLYT